MEKQKDGEILLHIRMRVKIQRVESLKGIGRRSGYYVYDMMTAIRKVFKTSTQKVKRSRRRDLNSPSMELTHGYICVSCELSPTHNNRLRRLKIVLSSELEKNRLRLYVLNTLPISASMFFPGGLGPRRHHRHHRRFYGRRNNFADDVGGALMTGAILSGAVMASNNYANHQPRYAAQPIPMQSAPNAACPPGHELMSVTCPQGMQSGMSMRVNVRGSVLEVIIPPHVYPGTMFQFAAPIARAQSNSGITIDVVCPQGTSGGQKVTIQTTNRGPMEVVVPAGVTPGQRFKVYVPAASAEVQAPPGSVAAVASMSMSAQPVNATDQRTSMNALPYSGVAPNAGLQSQTMTVPMKEGDQGWVQDQTYSGCMQCQVSFGMFEPYRRHHCRYCGRLLCGRCSSNKINALRSCRPCFEKKYPRAGIQSHAGTYTAPMVGIPPQMQQPARASAPYLHEGLQAQFVGDGSGVYMPNQSMQSQSLDTAYASSQLKADPLPAPSAPPAPEPSAPPAPGTSEPPVVSATLYSGADFGVDNLPVAVAKLEEK